MDKCSGKEINSMVSDIEGMEVRATKGQKSSELWKIKSSGPIAELPLLCQLCCMVSGAGKL